MARRDDREGLSSLNDLNDYEVANGEPDPRGWDVFASDGVRVGRIEDLLVDTDEMRVRAIECRIDEQVLSLPQGDNSMFIPIRSVSLDESAQRAVVPTLRSDQVESFRGSSDFSTFDSASRNLGTSGTTGTTGTGETSRTTETTGTSGTGSESVGRSASGGRTGRESGREESHILRANENLDAGTRGEREGEIGVRRRGSDETRRADEAQRRDRMSEPMRDRPDRDEIERGRQP